MSGARTPAVAGSFYPSDPDALRKAVEGYLRGAGVAIGALEPGATSRTAGAAGSASTGASELRVPKILIVPHAGLPYSGPVAASAYARWAPARARIRRVVLLGPSHHVPFRGLAASSADRFATPLGSVPVDADAVARALALPQVQLLDEAHLFEHSLEVQLPFLQTLLEDFSIVPLVAGSAAAEPVADAIDALYGGPETAVVVSSDLSHYYDYATAQRLDRETTRAIEALRPEGLGEESACGRVPVRGALVAARRHGLGVSTLDLRSSGDTAGPRDAVVGYGAYALA